MGPLIVIPGLSNATKRPDFYGQIVNPAGQISQSSIPLILLLVGNKTSTGTLTVDSAPVQIFSADDADTLAGPGSELATMCYGIGGTGAAGGPVGGALASDGVSIFIAAQAEAGGGATTASATITIAGSWSTAGTLTYRLSGIKVPVNVGATDTATTVANNIVLAINGNARLPFTASNIAGVVTIVTKNKGPRNNWHSLFVDLTSSPAGLTSTLAGGSAMTGGGVHFTGGAGNDSPTNLLAVILPSQFDRIVPACGDATLDGTQQALWKAQLNTQAGPTIGILQQVIIASNDTLTNAASLSVTTLNNTRFEVLQGLNIETHPAVIAATFGAHRAVEEQSDPDTYYDSAIDPNALPGVAPQTQNADRHTAISEETALGEGVTPLLTFPDGTVRISRAITSYCRNGSNPDYRVLDTSQTTVPDFVLEALSLLWTSQFLPANPRVEDNPSEDLPTPIAGVATPNLWSAAVFDLLQDFGTGKGFATGLPILDANAVLANPPISTFVGGATPRIMSAVPIIPAANQHIIGVSVRNVTTV